MLSQLEKKKLARKSFKKNLFLTVSPVVGRREELSLVELARLERGVRSSHRVVVGADVAASQVAVPFLCVLERGKKRKQKGNRSEIFWGRSEEKKKIKKRRITTPSLVVLAAARLRAELGAGVAVGDVGDLLEELGLAVAAPGKGQEGEDF